MNDLYGKNVWDLTTEEIEYVFENLHMNNYTYAALMTYRQSKMPLNQDLKVRKRDIPDYLVDSTETIVRLACRLSSFSDVTELRVKLTLAYYELFKQFKYLKIEDLDCMISLLSALTFTSILSDKNDNVLLWASPVIRQNSTNNETLFSHIVDDINVYDFVQLKISKGERIQLDNRSKLQILFIFIQKAVESIIVKIENGLGQKIAADAFQKVENNMRQFEYDNDIGNKEKFLGNIKTKSQLRDRSTLYLYGGNNFERMKQYEKAFSWYVRDIYFPEITDLFHYHLTDFRTCERLMCAYRITEDDGLTSGIAAAIGGTSATARIFLNQLTEKAYSLLFEEGISKESELEADSVSLEILTTLGYDWGSYRNYLSGIADKHSGKQGQVLSKTHPSIPQRLEHISTMSRTLNLTNSHGKTNVKRFRRYQNLL